MVLIYRFGAALFITFFLAIVFCLSCNQSAKKKIPEMLISCDSVLSKISFVNKSDTLTVIKAENYHTDSLISTTKWELDYPVFQFDCGDINMDGCMDIFVGVIKKTRFDPYKKKRIFIFKVYEGYIRPLWLGSKVSRPLVDFRFIAGEPYNYVRTIEMENDGQFQVCEYRWKGFGLYFMDYSGRNLNENSAYKILNR